MKRFYNPLLSFSAPFLIVVAIFSFSQRGGKDKIQALPALLVGSGLILSGAFERRRRRKQLLVALKNTNESKPPHFF